MIICWSNFCIFLVLARVVYELNIAIRSSRTYAMKRTDGRAIGTECQGCGKLFGTLFAYDQHRCSKLLRGTACCALPDENRMIVTAAPRPNMSEHSTAALERRPAQRTRGGGQTLHILHILQIMHIWHIAMISKRAYPLR